MKMDLQNLTKLDCYDTENSLARGYTNSPSQIIDISRYEKKKKFPYCLQIDWLTITFDFATFKENKISPDKDSLILINEIIDIVYPGKTFNDFEYLTSFRNGYQKKIVISENIEFFFFGAECANGNQSIMLDITGNGMTKLSDSQIYKLYKFCFNPYHLGRITRSDPGFDNHTRICNLMTLKQKCDEGLYKSRFKNDIYYSGKNKDYKGLTIYFGKGSDLCLRIYDKNAERAKKDPKFVKEYQIWNRYEIQCRDSVRNHQFALMYMLAYEKQDMSIFARYVADVMVGIVMFQEYQIKGSKKIKVPFKEWMQLLDHYSGIKMRVSEKASFELDKKIDWCNRSVFNTLAMIYLVFGKTIFEKWIYRAIGLNLLNIDDLNLSVVNAKNEEMGVLNFEKDEIKKIGQILIDQHEDLNGVLKAFIKKEWQKNNDSENQDLSDD